jgi:nickel/cobalt transporter (NicO) family protein
MTRNNFKKLGAGCLVALMASAGPALAHPHVWIDAAGEVLFEDGAIVGMRHHWTFDEYFSAWAIQGLDADGDGDLTPEELQPLAEENIEGLDFYSYYTFADPEGLDGHAAVAGAGDPSMVYEDGRVTLTFSMQFAEPQTVGGIYDIEVGDPEYYAAFTFPEDDSVTLEGAPEQCSVVSKEPQPIDPELEEQLWMLGPDVTEIPADLREAARAMANLVTVTCPGGVPATALDAIGQATSQRPPSPFSAPPPETSLVPTQGGFFGWVGEQQRRFYGTMTSALGALRTDGNAFWLLGGLSFLYGIFHAAGPGHGKVVISSYVLANERQLRRGIVLSFLSAMMQSAVAVAFVLVAAGVLQLTSMAMSRAAWWMEIISYGMVALLGAWLAARKLVFPHRHHHGHAADGGHSHDHDHDHHDHSCEHHVTPQQARGGWKESLGVVVSVGLRPCSGALVVLVFALSQGVLAAGIAATFLMGLGTAITVAVLASLAVYLKGGALRLTGNGAAGETLVWWLELAGALLVMAFGMILLFAAI